MSFITVEVDHEPHIINTKLIEQVEDYGSDGARIRFSSGDRLITSTSFNVILKGIAKSAQVFALEAA